MIETKQIKVHEIVYNKLKEELRFNESFSDYIYRILRERDESYQMIKGVVNEMQKMRKKD